jgi:hypothetical protein
VHGNPRLCGSRAYKGDVRSGSLYEGSNSVEDVDQNGNVLARYIMTQSIDEPLAELRSGSASYYS